MHFSERQLSEGPFIISLGVFEEWMNLVAHCEEQYDELSVEIRSRSSVDHRQKQ